MRFKRTFFILILVAQTLPIYAQYTLRDYIEFAQQNSPLIKDNLNQIRASDFEIQRLKALYTKFQLGLSGNYLFAPIVSTDDGRTKLELNSDGAERYYGYDLAQTNGGLYQGMGTFNQPILNNRRFRAFAEQIEVNKQVNENTIKLTRHDLEKSVTTQYIQCLLDKKQVIYYDSILSLLNDQLFIVRKLAQASLLKESDLLLLNIEYENSQNLLAAARATYRRDLFDLQILCGQEDTTFVILPDISMPLQISPARSGYLEKYRLDSISLFVAQRIFETKYLPQINLFGNAGLNAVYAPLIPQRFGFSAGLTATWDLYDGHQKQLMRNKSNVQLETISFYRENFNIQNAVRKSKILAELRSNAERRILLQNQLSEYQNVLLAYEKELMLGQLSIINYITVLKNMIAVKRDYYILDANDLLLANEYNYWNW